MGEREYDLLLLMWSSFHYDNEYGLCRHFEGVQGLDSVFQDRY